MLAHLIKGAEPGRIGMSIALLATLCYSLKPIIIKLIYQYDISSADILAWRVIISLPIYLIVGGWLWYSSSRRRKQLNKGSANRALSTQAWVAYTIVLGALGFYVAALFDLIGLQFISSQLARLILFTYPTLVAVLGWMIFKQKVSKRVTIAIVLSYVGVGLIFAYDFSHLGSQVLFGSLMMFLSVLAFSLYVLLSKKIIDQVGGTSFTVVAMLSSGVCILLHFLVSAENFAGANIQWMAFLLIAIMTIITTVIPSFLIAEAIALIGPQRTAIAGTIGPAMTSVAAVFILGEAFGISQIAGIILVIAAISYMQHESSDIKNKSQTIE